MDLHIGVKHDSGLMLKMLCFVCLTCSDPPGFKGGERSSLCSPCLDPFPHAGIQGDAVGQMCLSNRKTPSKGRIRSQCGQGFVRGLLFHPLHSKKTWPKELLWLLNSGVSSAGQEAAHHSRHRLECPTAAMPCKYCRGQLVLASPQPNTGILHHFAPISSVLPRGSAASH